MWVDEYSAHVAAVPDSTRALLLRMSDRTMSRALAGEICIKPGWPRANRRSGRNGANEDKGDGPRRLRREDHGVQRPAGRHPGRHIRWLLVGVLTICICLGFRYTIKMFYNKDKIKLTFLPIIGLAILVAVTVFLCIA